jgi:hypothetical protein
MPMMTMAREPNQGLQLQAGDMLLLCSDGLTDLVDDEEILSAVSKPGTEEALLELVRLANERGGHDNITMVTLGVPALERQTVPIGAREMRSRWAMAGVVMSAGFIGVGSAGGFLLVLQPYGGRPYRKPGDLTRGRGYAFSGASAHGSAWAIFDPAPGRHGGAGDR